MPKIPRNPITLERPTPSEQPLQGELNNALVRELLFRTKGAGVALLAATLLMWLIINPENTAAFAAFAALVTFTVVRTAGAVWVERRPAQRFRTRPVFTWFAATSFLIGVSLGAIIITSYQHLPPFGVAMCSICIIGINSAAMLSLAGSPLVYLLYVGSNMVALTFVAFAHPVAGLEHPFQAMQFIYSAALFAMMRSVHRSLRNNIVLRLQLADSLSELRAMQTKLIETSRQAGRADVATAVIHNVGNVLNSVNISAEIVARIVDRSRIANLTKVQALIDQHRDDLAMFFRDDPRGQKLPDYFTELAAAAGRDQQSMRAELQSLGRNIDRIKVIIQAQQSHATPSQAVETFDVRDMLGDTLELHAASFDKHAIEVVRAFDSLPPVTLDRYNVLQIVTNLLANACDAVTGCEVPPRRITLGTRRAGREIEIFVEDNGCGIEPSNLERIFQLGFTTKTEGRGLGLHFSACIAGELKGRLTAHSDGPGKGAKFVLALPLASDGADRPPADEPTIALAAPLAAPAA